MKCPRCHSDNVDRYGVCGTCYFRNVTRDDVLRDAIRDAMDPQKPREVIRSKEDLAAWFERLPK